MLRKLKKIFGRLLPTELRGRIRNWRLQAIVRRFTPRTVSHTYGGHHFQIRLTDPLSAGWYDHDWPVLTEVRFLREYKLRSGATVFDLGAHHGIVALMLAREVEPNGRVVAVEANPHNAAAAEANARLNRADNMIVRCAAAADRPGTITFNAGLNGRVDDGSGEWGRIEVAAVTIDQLTEELGPPHVLFIDVEGFECQALRGAAATITRHRPDCFLEVHLGKGLEKFGSLNELLTFFPAETYSLFFLPGEDPAASPVLTTRENLQSVRERFFLLAVARD
jgi:FkbM family methyltransferase